ncbi:hypothetical protein DYBT9275_02313 [Dyadobacter sp. CECT 9275]|uniref:Uncharacterized protein n=1 Tax=Dyadobacter helix TaxID=2822344 RepID=A0A916NC57_9BACT|nr:DUF6252 family protein [Dyadobacter sp. CECT 9275]CAG4999814.1 hypothetical protein DYBT9275_02313 [Dyadobacter sp. CECT 9275]
MKKSKRKVLSLLFYLAFLLLYSCREKEVLPDSTQSGKNTFGVIIDGKTWLPKKGFGVIGDGGPPLTAGYTNHKIIGIQAKRGVVDEMIRLKIADVKSAGTYTLDDNFDGILETKYYGKEVDDEYLLFQGGKNEIIVTKLDTTNKIVSGTFNVQLKGKQNQKIINLTNGTFDAIYQDY